MASLEKGLEFLEFRSGLTVVIKLLRLIVPHPERDGFTELQLRSSVQGHKSLTFGSEFDKHGTRFVLVSLLACFAVVLLVCDLPFLKKRA